MNNFALQLDRYITGNYGEDQFIDDDRPTAAEAVRWFLKQHHTMSYTAWEIADRTGHDISTVRKVLNKLEADHKVTKRAEMGTYKRSIFFWQWA